MSPRKIIVNSSNSRWTSRCCFCVEKLYILYYIKNCRVNIIRYFIDSSYKNVFAEFCSDISKYLEKQYFWTRSSFHKWVKTKTRLTPKYDGDKVSTRYHDLTSFRDFCRHHLFDQYCLVSYHSKVPEFCTVFTVW